MHVFITLAAESLSVSVSTHSCLPRDTCPCHGTHRTCTRPPESRAIQRGRHTGGPGAAVAERLMRKRLAARTIDARCRATSVEASKGESHVTHDCSFCSGVDHGRR